MKKASLIRVIFSICITFFIQFSLFNHVVASNKMCAIHHEAAAIGGITIGSSMEYVESIYGTEHAVKTTPFNNQWERVIYNYNNRFTVMGIVHNEDGKTIVYRVISTDKSLGAEGGFCTGMHIGTVVNKYGKTYIFKDKNGKLIYKYSDKSTMVTLEFTVNPANKIIEEVALRYQSDALFID